jgi:hypothetical protein
MAVFFEVYAKFGACTRTARFAHRCALANRHCAGFEPQRASPFMKRVKASQYSEKPPEPDR